MKISVVINTYSRPKLVKRAIKSVISQTYDPNEIIVIEDSSDSGIKEWISSNYHNISYHKNNENLGLAGSRNMGIKLSNFEWIAFIDDDDEWLPNRLEEQVKCFNKIGSEEIDNLACIQVGSKLVNTEGKIENIHLPINDGNLAESIQKYGASTPSSSFLFKKSALENIEGFDVELISGIDHDIWMKLAVAGYTTKAIKKPLVMIHQDDRETMQTNTLKRIIGIKQYVDKWEMTYQEWYGKRKGMRYAKKYFINVISTLAAKKMIDKKYKEAWIAIKAVYKYKYSNIYSDSIIFGTYRLFRVYLPMKFPKLRSLKFWN